MKNSETQLRLTSITMQALREGVAKGLDPIAVEMRADLISRGWRALLALPLVPHPDFTGVRDGRTAEAALRGVSPAEVERLDTGTVAEVQTVALALEAKVNQTSGR